MEGEEVVKGTKEKARTAPTLQQLSLHLGQELAKLSRLLHVYLPVCNHSTKCLYKFLFILRFQMYLMRIHVRSLHDYLNDLLVGFYIPRTIYVALISFS